MVVGAGKNEDRPSCSCLLDSKYYLLPHPDMIKHNFSISHEISMSGRCPFKSDSFRNFGKL